MLGACPLYPAGKAMLVLATIAQPFISCLSLLIDSKVIEV